MPEDLVYTCYINVSIKVWYKPVSSSSVPAGVSWDLCTSAVTIIVVPDPTQTSVKPLLKYTIKELQLKTVSLVRMSYLTLNQINDIFSYLFSFIYCCVTNRKLIQYIYSQLRILTIFCHTSKITS